MADDRNDWNAYTDRFSFGGSGQLYDWLMDQNYVPLANEANQFLSVAV